MPLEWSDTDFVAEYSFRPAPGQEPYEIGQEFGERLKSDSRVRLKGVRVRQRLEVEREFQDALKQERLNTLGVLSGAIHRLIGWEWRHIEDVVERARLADDEAAMLMQMLRLLRDELRTADAEGG